MIVELRPGAKLDVLTGEELQGILAETLSGWRRGPETVRAFPDTGLDANGNTSVGSVSPAAVSLFEVPSGYRFALHRLAIKDDTHTAGDPYTNAGAYLELQRAGRVLDTIPLSGNYGIPVVFSYGTADAPIWDNNEKVELLIVGGPASTSLQVALQGTLEPLTIQ